MELNSDSQQKIYQALKSLYRYATLKSMKGPALVFDTETKVMKSKIQHLTPEELYCMVNMWQDFLKETLLEDALEDNLLHKKLNDKFAESVN
jgi:hypothetical protein